jgi:hypothetical protein
MGHVTVRQTGPLFSDSTPREVIADMLEKSEEAMADRLLGFVHANLKGSLRHPTGYYQSHVGKVHRGTQWRVTDGGVIYGPWLEGVSRRNARTRFKGYASFRRARQQVQRVAAAEVQRVADQQIGRLQ